MNQRKRDKILMLITNLGRGGAQRVFYDHALFLKKNYEVSEAVFNKAEEERLYDSALALYSLDVNAGSNWVNKILNFFKRAIRLKELVRSNHFQLVISHMDGANWVNVLSNSKAKKIAVVHGTIFHDHAINKYIQKVRVKWIIPTLYKRADYVVTVSEGIKKELETFCHLRNVVAIPNAFDIDLIIKRANEPLPGEWQTIFNYEVLVTSGRLHEQKKQHQLLHLFKALKSQRASLKLVILGDGPLRAALIKESSDLGLQTFSVWQEQQLSNDYDVYFPGYLSNPFQFLKKSTLFLFPSGWEGFPLALCEAMIAGVPVLTADCPTGPREILAPGTFDLAYQLTEAEKSPYGYLMPMTDKKEFISAWSRAVLELLDNPTRRLAMITHARERVKTYDKALVMSQWMALIEKTLQC